MTFPEILLIEDNKHRAQHFETILCFMECAVTVISSAEMSHLDTIKNFDILFLGADNLSKMDSIKQMEDIHTSLPIYLITNKNDECLLDTSSPYPILQWPTTHSVLNEILLNINQQTGSVPKKNQSNKGLAGNSKAIQQIREAIDQVAKSEATVLILGESGTGKEVVAQALHRSSSRKEKPFVPVNCGAIPAELLESELFGHEKGAFTGALTARQGRFEMAEGGTLFLDEIGDMPMPMQVKLLRVLQERSFERVGSNKTIQSNVRIIAATHRNLEMEISEKRFREDLFYRLNVFPIEMPALRERIEDLPHLINDLVSKMILAQRGSVQFTPQAIAKLRQHSWPGNVRELSNLIERLSITHPEGMVDAKDLPEKFQIYEIPDHQPDIRLEENFDNDFNSDRQNMKDKSVNLSKVHLPEQGIDLKEYLTDLENELIRQALNECNGVVAHAAKLLNMRRTTLVEKLRKVD